MKRKIGRPSIDNPKNIDVKVRFDKETHEELLKYCGKENISRTELIRKGVKEVMKLKKGLEYDDFKEYDEFLTEFNSDKFENMDRQDKNKCIFELNEKIDNLGRLLEEVRDRILSDEYGLTYDEVFKKGIEVQIQVDSRLFELQRRYYKLIEKLYSSYENM